MQVGVDIGSYSFNAGSKKITFTGVGLTSIEQIKPIINGTKGVVIFNPAQVGYFGSFNVGLQELTLEFDTTLQSNTDKLYICVNLPDIELATEATLFNIDGKLNSLGQKAMAGSVPVVLASDQTPISTSSTDEAATTQTTDTVAASVTSVLLKAANSARKEIVIRNDSVKPMYICLFTPATFATPFKLGKDEVWVMSKWKGAIYGIWETGATDNAYITEQTT